MHQVGPTKSQPGLCLSPEAHWVLRGRSMTQQLSPNFLVQVTIEILCLVEWIRYRQILSMEI